MNKYIILFFLISIASFSKSLNVKEFGAHGDGIKDDWSAIQKAITFAFKNKYDTLVIPEGKYLVSKTLVINGSNLVITGDKNGFSLLEKNGNPGWWGDLMYICGKLPGNKFFDEDNSEYTYSGVKEYSENLVITNLSFKNTSKKKDLINNLGIVNSKNIYIKNCVFLGSSNANVAIVNDLLRYDNVNINLLNCVLKNAKTHNLRVLSMNEGDFVKNEVYVKDCQFLNTGITNNKELLDSKVHIWYRGGGKKEGSGLEILDSYFDNSGIVHSTKNSNNLIIKNSSLEKGYVISNNVKHYPNSKIRLENVKTSSMATKKIIGVDDK